MSQTDTSSVATAVGPANSQFNFSNMNWQDYKKYRPQYPAALYDMVYRYHDEQGGSCDSAVDIGAGPGIVTEQLLHRFSHVTLSDPSAEYIAQARSVFETANRGRVSFVQAGAEDLTPKDMPDGQAVDMLASGEAIHWTNMAVVATKLHAILKPGGTLALWVYGTTPVFPDNEQEIDAAFQAANNKIFDVYESKIDAQMDQKGAGPSINSRLDSIRLDPALWKDAQRLHTHYEHTMSTPRWGRTPSAVQAGESVKILEDDALLSREVDHEYLEGYVDNIAPLDIKNLAAKELAHLKEVMGERKVLIKWPLSLVLARRR